MNAPPSVMAGYLRIGLVPLGGVGPALLGWLKEDIPTILPARIEEFPALHLSPRYFNRGRDQYLADGLLADLASCVRPGEMMPLGVTMADLFSPPLNFVFGIACGGRALISVFRLRPEISGDSPNLKLYRWRILTEAIHELGHALGLPHCEYPGCVMFFSNGIGDTDRKGPRFCYRCDRRLEQLLGKPG